MERLRGPLPWKVKLAFIVLCLVFSLVLAGLGIVISQNRQLARDGRQAHDALCVSKFSTQRRYNVNKKLLETYTGSHIFGIPRDLIVLSQKNLKTDLQALSILDCVPPPDLSSYR